MCAKYFKKSDFFERYMKDVAKVIDDLNSTGASPKFEAFISLVEQENN